MHTCSIRNCPKSINREHLMCGTHWNMVSLNLQRDVWAAWRAFSRKPCRETNERLKNVQNAATASVQAKLDRQLLEDGEKSLFGDEDDDSE